MPERLTAILAKYNLQPEAILGVSSANLPAGEPVISLTQASRAAPAYLAPHMAELLAMELEHAGQSEVASRIKKEVEKARAQEPKAKD
jgi:hypothetical protein